MALSKRSKDILTVAMADKRAATEVSEALSAIQIATPAATVTALGTTTNIPTASVTLSTSNTYTDAAVKASVDAGLNSLRTAAEARLDAIEAKVDAILTSLKNAGLMS